MTGSFVHILKRMLCVALTLKTGGCGVLMGFAGGRVAPPAAAAEADATGANVPRGPPADLVTNPHRSACSDGTCRRGRQRAKLAGVVAEFSAGSRSVVEAPEDGLLDRAVAGDREALTQLLERHGPRVRRNLEHGIPPRWQAVMSADDVMQETYIDAFLDVSRFEPRGEGSFTAWLTQLAKRNLLDAVRMLDAEKRGKKRRIGARRTADGSLAALAEQLLYAGTTPSRQMAREEAGVCLQRAIAQLPPTYRTVVEMYDLEGRTVEDVAAALQRSEGAVFMLRARAHRQMGAILGAASRFLSGTP